MSGTSHKFDLTRYECLGDAFRDTVVRNRDHVALIEANRDRENGRWTYDQVRIEAERFAALLQDHGVKPETAARS